MNYGRIATGLRKEAHEIQKQASAMIAAAKALDGKATRHLSADARERISLAQKKRWAAFKRHRPTSRA